MNKPRFDLDKIKYGVDPATFKKAVDLYKKGKIKNFKEALASYTADVIGTKIYHVSMESRDYRYCFCNCYVGQNDTLCKHAVAVAIYATLGGKKLTKEDETQITKPESSGVIGKLTEDKLKDTKLEITKSISYIKYYDGPSRTWFSYQNSLDEGVNRLSKIVSELPISIQTADLVINLLLRLDKKLQSGIDDSNGTVGGFIEETVEVLKDFVKKDPKVTTSFKKLIGINSCFGWEEMLVKMINN